MTVAAALEAAATQYGVGSEATEIPEHLKPFVITRARDAEMLGVAPGDSRFCSKADGFTALYASPEFATAFIETGGSRTKLRHLFGS